MIAFGFARIEVVTLREVDKDITVARNRNDIVRQMMTKMIRPLN